MLKKLLTRDDGATLIQVLIGGAVVLVLVVTAANWGAEKVDQTVQDVTKANDARNRDLDALIAKEFKCKGGSATGGTTGGGKAGGQTVSPMVDYLAFTCPEENEPAQVTGMVPADNGATVQRQNDPADGGTVPAAPPGDTVQHRPEDDDHSTSTNTTTTTETETNTDPHEEPHQPPPDPHSDPDFESDED